MRHYREYYKRKWYNYKMVRKSIKWIGYGLIALLVLGLLFMNIFMPMMQYSDADIAEFFADSSRPFNVVYKDINGSSIRVVEEELAPSDSVLVVFAHGAPGSWDAFKDYLHDDEISSRGRLIAYDRTGYGGSSAIGMPSIIDHARILQNLIRDYQLPKVVLVGHSYGCPIAGATAAYEDSVEDVVLIGSLIDPESEPIFWFSYFSHWQWSKWLLPHDLQIAGVEKFAHKESLIEIKPLWSQSDARVTFVHGLEDGLAPPQPNIDFISNNISEDRLDMKILKDHGHLVIWEEYELIKDVLLAVI